MAELVQIERIRKREFHERVREQNRIKKLAILEPQLPLDLLSKRLPDRLATPADEPIPECITCGVCCSFALIVPVTLEDSQRLNSYCDILLDDVDGDIVIERVLPRGTDGRCIHLEGELGTSIGCRIYPDRPSVCHEFDAGSDRCHEYRRMYGIEPQLDPEAVAAARERLEARPRPSLIEDVGIVSAGKIERTSYSAAEGTVQYSEIEQLSIVAFLEGEEPHVLHTFEHGAEEWFESDLLGLSLEEAANCIEEQTGH